MSSHIHGYHQRIRILLAVWQVCVTRKPGGEGNWGCFLCFVNRILMFTLYGNLGCQEKRQHLKAGKRHRTEKGVLKSQPFLLLKEKLWNGSSLLVDEEWRMNCIWQSNINVCGADRTMSSHPSWWCRAAVLGGENWSEMWWQHSRTLLMCSLNFSTVINLRAVTQSLTLSLKKKKIEIKWAIWKIVCPLQR